MLGNAPVSPNDYFSTPAKHRAHQRAPAVWPRHGPDGDPLRAAAFPPPVDGTATCADGSFNLRRSGVPGDS